MCVWGGVDFGLLAAHYSTLPAPLHCCEAIWYIHISGYIYLASFLQCAAGCMQTRAVVCVEASSRIEVDTTYCQRVHDPPFSQQPCDNGDCTHAK